MIKVYETGILYTNNKKIGIVREYNPKKHEAYVTLDILGIEEFGALDSTYEVRVNDKRIPNRWDNKRDYNKEFFGE